MQPSFRIYNGSNYMKINPDNFVSSLVFDIFDEYLCNFITNFFFLLPILSFSKSPTWYDLVVCKCIWCSWDAIVVGLLLGSPFLHEILFACVRLCLHVWMCTYLWLHIFCLLTQILCMVFFCLFFDSAANVSESTNVYLVERLRYVLSKPERK